LQDEASDRDVSDIADKDLDDQLTYTISRLTRASDRQQAPK